MGQVLCRISHSPLDPLLSNRQTATVSLSKMLRLASVNVTSCTHTPTHREKDGESLTTARWAEIHVEPEPANSLFVQTDCVGGSRTGHVWWQWVTVQLVPRSFSHSFVHQSTFAMKTMAPVKSERGGEISFFLQWWRVFFCLSSHFNYELNAFFLSLFLFRLPIFPPPPWKLTIRTLESKVLYSCCLLAGSFSFSLPSLFALLLIHCGAASVLICLTHKSSLLCCPPTPIIWRCVGLMLWIILFIVCLVPPLWFQCLNFNVQHPSDRIHPTVSKRWRTRSVASVAHCVLYRFSSEGRLMPML